MRLARFWRDRELRVGIVDGQDVLDVTGAANGSTDLVALLTIHRGELERPPAPRESVASRWRISS